MPEVTSVFDINTIMQAGATGVLAWLVWYCATKLIPKMIDKHTNAMNSQTEAFERINKEQRDEFRSILEADRERAVEREERQRKDFKEALSQVTRCSVKDT